MKKIIISFALVLTLASNSIAFAPLAIPVGYWAAAAALHVAGAATGLYYAMRDGSPSSVDSSGNITRPSNAVWIDLNVPSPAVKSNPITAKLSNETVYNISTYNPEKYPLLFDASNKLVGPIYPPVSDAKYPTGTKVSLDGKNVTLTLKSETRVGWLPKGSYALPYSNLTSNSVYINDGPKTVYISGSGYYYDAYETYSYSYVVDAAVPPSQVKKTIPEYLTSLTVDGAAGQVKPEYQAEIDKMLQDPGYVPVFTDDTNWLPYVPPPSDTVATPQEVEDYNKRGVATNPTVTTTTGLPVTTNNPDGTSTTTQTTTISGGPDGTKTSTTSTTTSGPDGTGTVLAQTKVEETTDVDIAPPLPSDNVYSPLGDNDKPSLKNITDLLGSFISSSPLVSMVKSFSISTSDASGVVPIGTVYGQELSFDFTRWESTLRACGGVLIIIMHGMAVFIVVRGW